MELQRLYFLFGCMCRGSSEDSEVYCTTSNMLGPSSLQSHAELRTREMGEGLK